MKPQYYLERLEQHWADSIEFAKRAGATALQLEAMDCLAEMEFGYRSGLRLRYDCFWKTSVDKDGDVLLLFIGPWYQDEAGETQMGDRVCVYIDHYGVLTTKNLTTDEVVVYDPNGEEHRQWLAKNPAATKVWVLDNRMFRSFTEPSIKLFGNRSTGYFILVTETGECFSPFLLSKNFIDRNKLTDEPTVVRLRSISYYDGPLAGFARVNGELQYFDTVHEDDVSGERVYVLHELSRWEKVKSHVDDISWKLELKINRLLGWPKRGRWIKLPRFGNESLINNNITGYFV